MIRHEDPLAPQPALRRIAARVATSEVGVRTAGWYLRNVVSRIESSLSKWSRGRLTSLPISPVVFLERPDWKPTPLTYFTDGDDVILIASNFGRGTNPAWYRAIKSMPDVTLRARGRRGRYVVHEAVGEERERLWAIAVRWTPPLATYQAMAGSRQIPILRCTPATEAK